MPRHVLGKRIDQGIKLYGLLRYTLMMNNAHTETLLKMNHPICEYIYTITDVHCVRKHWAQIKIANRHHYDITDIKMWYDTIDLLESIGKDTHSPKYICPNDLRAVHDWALSKHRGIEEREKRKREREIAEQNDKAYRERMSAFIGIAFDGNGLHAHVLRSVGEFVEEADYMHHCVYSNRYWDKADCIILSVRDDNGNRLATIEYKPSIGRIIQCYARYNRKPEQDGEIRRFIQSNAHRFAV